MTMVMVCRRTTRNRHFYYKKGCDGDDYSSCYNLAISYDEGEGVEKDHVKAVSYYKKACDGGDVDACYNLGVSYDQ